jgi:hypothetical protein
VFDRHHPAGLALGAALWLAALAAIVSVFTGHHGLIAPNWKAVLAAAVAAGFAGAALMIRWWSAR